MLRAIALSIAILSLCVTSFWASLHGAQMGFAQAVASSGVSHQDSARHAGHSADVQPSTVLACVSTQDCGLDAALCGWVCLGGGAMQPVRHAPAPSLALVAHLVPAEHTLLKGVLPPLDERPPNITLL